MAVMNLTIDVPEGVADRFQTLPENDRRDFIAKMNAFAVATLADEENDIADNLAPVPATDVTALRESLSEAQQGKRLNGPAVMRELFSNAAASAPI